MTFTDDKHAGSSRADKGKGKEREADEQEEHAADERSLDGQDETSPREAFSSVLKLVEANKLLSDAVLDSVGTSSGYAMLPMQTYAAVTKLLSDTISDLSSAPSYPIPPSLGLATHRYTRKKTAYAPRPSIAIPPAPLHDPLNSPQYSLDYWGISPAYRSQAQEPTGPTPVYLEKLPAEILLMIIDEARSASLQQAAAPVRDEWGEVYRSPVQPDGTTLQETAQRFVLNLGLVCKKWLQPARAIAFRNVFGHRSHTLVRLNKLLASPVSSVAASQITSLDVLVAPFESYPPLDDGGWGVGRVSSNSSLSVKDRNIGDQFLTLVTATKSLSKLKLTLADKAGGWSRSNNPVPAFLESSVFAALTSLPALRALELSFSIDFEELEAILHASPLLESVALVAVSNLDQPAIHSSSPHPATRIRSFLLGNPENAMHFSTNLLAAQLVWLIEPAVESLTTLAVLVVSDSTWVGGAQTTPPAWASAEFADLLARMAEKLEKLFLQELGARGQATPSFAQAPHNNSFDHALSSLSSLKQLALPAAYTGAQFLPSLSSCLKLEDLGLSGIPQHTPASAFIAALDGGEWKKLKCVTVAGAFGAVGGGRGGWGGWAGGWGAGGGAGAGGTGGTQVWSGGERRKLEEIARRRGIEWKWE
ncbi:hypothetical protein JCM8547_001981 [Rhodosporidiobolus lusitaniae]